MGPFKSKRDAISGIQLNLRLAPSSIPPCCCWFRQCSKNWGKSQFRKNSPRFTSKVFLGKCVVYLAIFDAPFFMFAWFRSVICFKNIPCECNFIAPLAVIQQLLITLYSHFLEHYVVAEAKAYFSSNTYHTWACAYIVSKSKNTMGNFMCYLSERCNENYMPNFW